MRPIALLTAAAAVLLSGCSATYEHHAVLQPSAKLQMSKSVLIATPADGVYGARQYAGSGNQTTMAVRAAFARYVSSVDVSVQCRDLACLRNLPNGKQQGYLVVPEVLHWEDRATEWSGKRDKIEIKISVYDGETGQSLASSIITGKSKKGTFGGDHPQDLLPEPVNSYIQSLYY